MICSLSKLDNQKIETIKSVEKEMGKTILAFTCHDLAPAQLSPGELAKIQAMEKETGLTLVAVKS